MSLQSTFRHPVHGLPVRRVFTAHAQALFPSAVLADPEHPWLSRQEAGLPKDVLAVIYYRAAVELVRPCGVSRRPLVGHVKLRAAEPDGPPPAPARSAKQIAAAERTRAWKAANPERVRSQHQRQAARRKAERDQLHEAAAATNRAA